MYRFYFNNSEKFQKILSKELMNGFDYTFNFSSNDPAAIVENICDFFGSMGYELEEGFKRDALVYKVVGMYEELADEEYEYTFDELGEWILYKCIELAYGGTIAIGFPWESSLSSDDCLFMSTIAADYSESLRQEILEDEDIDYDDEYGSMYDDLYNALTMFPCLYSELIDETPDILFDDRDFLFIEDLGIEKFIDLKDKVEKFGDFVGFSAVKDNTQLYTGSDRYGMSHYLS